jgi:hypothetical protein
MVLTVSSWSRLRKAQEYIVVAGPRGFLVGMSAE